MRMCLIVWIERLWDFKDIQFMKSLSLFNILHHLFVYFKCRLGMNFLLLFRYRFDSLSI